MPGYTFFPVDPRLAEVVEAIWETDIPDAKAARSIVMPVVTPILCFHYRWAPALCFDLRARLDDQAWIAAGRFRITGVQSRAAGLLANGPVGGVMVRLKPETAARLARGAVTESYDAAFLVGDVFGPSDASLLEDMLAAASTAAQRVAAVQSFLLRRLRDDAIDPLVRGAIFALRREPSLRVRGLAAQLGVSERHLSRRFRAATGATAKQFARIVRIGRVVAAARRQREGWAEIAISCGFSDQAHMVNDFSAMIGSAPEEFFQRTALLTPAAAASSAAESDFFNTFLVDRATA
jgi:AraC-like DNA-binding protein